MPKIIIRFERNKADVERYDEELFKHDHHEVKFGTRHAGYMSVSGIGKFLIEALDHDATITSDSSADDVLIIIVEKDDHVD